MNVGDNTSQKKFESLGQRLQRAREKSREKTDPSSSTGKGQSVYSSALRLGTEMVSALIVGVGIGYFLDYWLETKPWFLVIFFFFGAGAGVLNVYRSANLFDTPYVQRELTDNISNKKKRKSNQW